ncbi:MAG TPA: S8 family serine peptidase [Gaiellaceae bacterium]|nr:S8 family serine peptidase [Gaiellaceae bacterium]
MKRGLLLLAAVAAVCALGGANAGVRTDGRGSRTEVVVALKRPSLAVAMGLRARRSPAYLRKLDAGQAELVRQILERIPSAKVRWRYRYVLDGLAVVVPRSQIGWLASLPGVERVYPSVRYSSLLDESVPLIHAPQLWGPTRATAGQGIKIGIIDDGVDQAHPFFNPAGFAMPAGFPKGNRSYTTAKVIVARAFPPPGATWKNAARPFDPLESDHATHVAGIAAGDYAATTRQGRPVSGVAPRAYIGNYKVLTVPTPSVGLNGNSPEIVKGIDAAVGDGMNVINLSLGEAEIDLDRDLVVKAINAAADAGVVPVIAAGNDFSDFGYGSISSPGDASKAITAAAVSKDDVIADFSSAGPSGIDLGFKPDVSAPGVNIYSSVPTGWDTFSGTSMASPHVAGGAALLLQRHPSWTPAQVKSALVLTGRPVWTDLTHKQEVLPTREGGGLIDLAAADNPLLFASPSSASFRFLHRGEDATVPIALGDAGGGSGVWTAAVRVQARSAGTTISVPATVSVPGTLALHSTVTKGAAQGDTTGFVVLSRGPTTRRIPFWLRVTVPKLGTERHHLLRRPGIYGGNTARKPSRVACYRYPSDPSPVDIAPCLRGPEQVFRVVLPRPSANFGVVVLSRARGVRVQPRVVRAGDENRLTGYAGLPLNLNPYLPTFDRLSPAAGAVRPDAGAYDVVFDTPNRRASGRFTFRFWVGDTKRPRIQLLTRSVRSGAFVRFRVTDAGSGVDPASLHATLDGVAVSARFRHGRVLIATRGLGRGRHRVVLRASDYQEAKNMENSGPILPNTRRLRTAFTIR